jgi:hypothetical protein
MADGRQVAEYGASGDDTTRFLHELRQLRDGASLDLAELAARAHYPYDIVRAAEAGPGLPDLPVLSAYVRGCGGTTEEWEERWRSLTRTPSLPLSTARSGGNSAASAAGARIGSAGIDGDTPDPAVIMAALNRVAEGMAEAPPPPPPLPPAPPAPPAPAVDPRPAQPAGWDPIRVSSAWPAIPSTPLAPPASRAPARGRRSAAAPWESAPWADDPTGAVADPRAAASGAPGQAWSGGTGSGAGATTAWASSPAAPVGHGPRHGMTPGGGQASSGARTKIIVAAVAVLIVLIVLLAILL